MTELKCLWEIPSTLGEGPLWVENEQAIYWVDIVENKVHRYTIYDQGKKTWSLDFMVTSLVEKDDDGFLGTTRDGFAFIDLDKNKFTPIQMPEAHIAGNRFNDGKLDSSGNFWAGSMDEAEKASTGSLYKLAPDLSVTIMDDGYTITNGPAFSPDGKTMYHIDSTKRVIYAFDANEGMICNKRVLYRFGDKSEGNPDGMTVDAEGNIWQTSFAGSRITKISPEGKVLEVIPMPVPNITSCTFGGSELDTLFITTARFFMSEDAIKKYPLAGSLFSLKPGVKGLPTPTFHS